MQNKPEIMNKAIPLKDIFLKGNRSSQSLKQEQVFHYVITSNHLHSQHAKKL